MKRTFPLLKFLRNRFEWARQGCLGLWRIGRFEYIPTDRNLLLTFWYDYAHYKVVARKKTMLDFLDSRVVYIKQELEKTDLSSKKRQMYRDLLGALYDPRLREAIIEFFLSPDPEEHCQQLIDMVKAAWRMGEVEKMPIIAGMSEPVGIGVRVVEADKEEKPAAVDTPHLHAKTYVIATEIHFELANRQAEYKRLSDYPPDLARFVQEKFGAPRLPGNFRKLKGYSYKQVLEEKSDAKLGQLKPNFRQIIGNAEIFGPAIVKRAQRMLDDYFL